MLHHVRPCLPVAVLYPSPLSACFSTLWWFSPGEGSCPTINHRTTGGHYPLWGRLFWVPGGPESLKRCVLRSACREEGGYSWWQRVRVGHLSFKHPFRHFSQVYVMSFVCALKSYHQILSVDCGGTAYRQNDADDWFHVWLQEEHHCAAVVPLLWAPAGEHLHSGAEYPRRQPWQPEEGIGGCTSGLKHTDTVN